MPKPDVRCRAAAKQIVVRKIETSKWVRLPFANYGQDVDVNVKIAHCDSECLVQCGEEVAYYTGYDWALKGICSSIEKK